MQVRNSRILRCVPCFFEFAKRWLVNQNVNQIGGLSAALHLAPVNRSMSSPDQPLDDPRREAFCHAYLRTYDLKASALEAEYSPKSAKVQGHRLMKRSDVQARIAHLKGSGTQRVQIDQDDVLRGWMQIATADIRDAMEWGIEPVLGEDGTPVTHPNGQQYMRPYVTPKASKDLPKHILAAISEVKMTEKGAFSIKFHDKTKALDSLARHFGMYRQDNEQVAAAAAGTVAALIAQAQGTPLPIAPLQQSSEEE